MPVPEGSAAAPQRSAIFESVARDLGLYCGPDFVEGLLDGVPVKVLHIAAPTPPRVTAGKHGHATTPAPHPEIHVVSEFFPPLDLGIVMGRHDTVRDSFGSVVGASRVTFSDQAFDTVYSVHADEATRLKSLLTPQCREHLASLDRRGPIAHLDDHAFFVRGADRIVTAEWLTSTLQVVAQIGGLLRQAAASIPLAEPLSSRKPLWDSFARENNLRITDTPLAVHGLIGGVSASVYAARQQKAVYGVGTTVSFSQPLGFGLHHRVGNRLAGMPRGRNYQGPVWGGLQPLISTYVDPIPTPSTTALLADGMREELLAIAQRLHWFEVTDVGVGAVAMMEELDPRGAFALIGELGTLARKLEDRAKSVRSSPPA